MKKPRTDLVHHLQKTRRQNTLKVILWPSIVILSIGLVFYGLTHLPWHWQLFIRWLIRGGDVTYIPERFSKELSTLCYTGSPNGKVDGYQGSLEIAYALGSFQCKRSSDRGYWIIEDTYTFARSEEASGGTQLAVLLVAVVGTDYSYKIEGIIPVVKHNYK